MIDYKAPDPYTANNASFMSWLLSYLVPSSQSIQQTIGPLILPAQMREAMHLSSAELDHLAARFNLTIETGFIGTYDEAIIDTIELSPKVIQNDSLENKCFIIKFNGNSGQYQDTLLEYARDAQKLDMTVIGFNYRGVGKSDKTPETFQDLITDGIAQVQRLLDNGVKSERILLDGISLGGGIATMVAKHFHKNGYPLYLWNDRSFASISKAAAGILAPTLPSIISYPIEASFETSSWSVMKPNGWDRNISSAYRYIPDSYKNYIVVARKSEQSSGDGVISHQASLHKAVRREEKKKGVLTGHKVLAQNSFFGGHNSDRRALISKDNPKQNGQELFEHFAMRLHQKVI